MGGVLLLGILRDIWRALEDIWRALEGEHVSLWELC